MQQWTERIRSMRPSVALGRHAQRAMAAVRLPVRFGIFAASVLTMSPIDANQTIEGPAPPDELRKGVRISDEDPQAFNLVLTGYTGRASALYRPFVDHTSFKSFSGTAPFLIATDLDGNTAPVRIIHVK